MQTSGALNNSSSEETVLNPNLTLLTIAKFVHNIDNGGERQQTQHKIINFLSNTENAFDINNHCALTFKMIMLMLQEKSIKPLADV